MFQLTRLRILSLFLGLALSQEVQAGLNIKTKLATVSAALNRVSQTPIMQSIAEAAIMTKNGVKKYPYLTATLAAATAGGYYVQKRYYQYDRQAKKDRNNRFSLLRQKQAAAAKRVTFGKSIGLFADDMSRKSPREKLLWITNDNPFSMVFLASGLLFTYSAICTASLPSYYFTLGKMFNSTSFIKHAEKSALFWMKANALIGSAVVTSGLALSLKIWLDARDKAAKDPKKTDLQHEYDDQFSDDEEMEIANEDDAHSDDETTALRPSGLRLRSRPLIDTLSDDENSL